LSLEHGPARARRLLTRRQLAEFLTEEGYKISVSTLAKMAMRGEGPEPEGWWGNRLLYGPTKALHWARRRFQPTSQAAA
jgi:hypothetical protein